jgi:hypothetical protein
MASPNGSPLSCGRNRAAPGGCRAALTGTRIIARHSHTRPELCRRSSGGKLAVGRLLRSASDLLERPTFGATEQANLTKLLEKVEVWADDNTAAFVTAYQQALLASRRSNECPTTRCRWRCRQSARQRSLPSSRRWGRNMTRRFGSFYSVFGDVYLGCRRRNGRQSV